MNYLNSTEFGIQSNHLSRIRELNKRICDMKKVSKNKQLKNDADYDYRLCKSDDYNKVNKSYRGSQTAQLLDNVSFRIFVRFNSGQFTEFRVTAQDTIRSVQALITDKYGLLPHQQRLGFNHQPLKSERTLQTYNISEDSMLRLKVENVPDFKVHFMDVSRYNTKYALLFTLCDSVRELKFKIADEIKTYPRHQMLEFNGNFLTDDEETLFHGGIKNESVLNVISAPFKIRIYPLNVPSFEVVVRSSNTVRFVKCVIMSLKGICPNRQELYFVGRSNGSALDDLSVLYHCGITEGTRLQLMYKTDLITFNLRTDDGQRWRIKADGSSTIAAVKQRMGLNPSRYLWLLAQQMLQNDERTLNECGITNNSQIDVVPYDLINESLAVQNVSHERDGEDDLIRDWFSGLISSPINGAMNDKSKFDEIMNSLSRKEQKEEHQERMHLTQKEQEVSIFPDLSKKSEFQVFLESIPYVKGRE